MMPSKPTRSLNRLVDLREREVDRLTADMAGKTALRDRYLSNLQRLEQLCKSAGASGAVSPALALNCAGYKQSVMQMAEAHREDLNLHEADMAVAQKLLINAARRHEVLHQVLEQRERQARDEQNAREQKRQDEVATQTWFRGQ